MKPGEIVVVDWRDALVGSGEPNKRRPAIVVGAPPFFGDGLPFEIVVPLTAKAALAMPGASVCIAPTATNGLTKPSFALSWNVQSSPHKRLSATKFVIADSVLLEIQAQIARCVGVSANL